MAYNKIIFKTGEVALDLTQDTVAPDTLLEGVTAHDANGELITGTAQQHVEPTLQEKTVTANGVVTADEGYDGLSAVTVNVSTATSTLQDKTVSPTTTVQTITADEGYDGLGTVTVEKMDILSSKTFTSNTTYTASTYGYDGVAAVTVNVPTYKNIYSGRSVSYVIAASTGLYTSSDNSTWTTVHASSSGCTAGYLPSCPQYVKIKFPTEQDCEIKVVAGYNIAANTYYGDSCSVHGFTELTGTITTDSNYTYVVYDLSDYDLVSIIVESTYEYYLPCFLEGTQITLADGSTKACEDITYDDELLVWDFYEGKFASAKPTWIKVKQVASQYNKVTFDNETEIGFVGPADLGYHRIFNKEAGKFTYTGSPDTPNGTTTFMSDGSWTKVVNQEIIKEPVNFYNIITDKHYNLFANGILTSCRLSNKYAIEDMKYVGDLLISKEAEEEYFKRIESLKV